MCSTGWHTRNKPTPIKYQPGHIYIYMLQLFEFFRMTSVLRFIHLAKSITSSNPTFDTSFDSTISIVHSNTIRAPFVTAVRSDNRFVRNVSAFTLSCIHPSIIHPSTSSDTYSDSIQLRCSQKSCFGRIIHPPVRKLNKGQTTHHRTLQLFKPVTFV